MQTRASQVGMVSTSLAIGTSEAADMLRTKASSVLVLPDGALKIENKAERPTVSALKGVWLNLVVLPHEALHLLQDGVIAELRAHEHRALQVINEQKINNEQMALQRNATSTAEAEATSQSKKIIQVVEEACRMVLDLAILEEEPVEVHIYKLAIGAHYTRTEMVQVQLELNL